MDIVRNPEKFSILCAVTKKKIIALIREAQATADSNDIRIIHCIREELAGGRKLSLVLWRTLIADS